jgi:flagellar protein FlaG
LKYSPKVSRGRDDKRSVSGGKSLPGAPKPGGKKLPLLEQSQTAQTYIALNETNKSQIVEMTTMDIQSPQLKTADLARQRGPQDTSSAQAPKAQEAAKKQESSASNIDDLRKNLARALGQINEKMRDGGRNLNFSMDETLGVPIIQVKKQDTGEIVRQIPSEEFVKFAHQLERLKGFLIDKGV